jgi:hypothetical protein
MTVIAIGKIKDRKHTIVTASLSTKQLHDINNTLNRIVLTTELREFKRGKSRYTKGIIEGALEIAHILEEAQCTNDLVNLNKGGTDVDEGNHVHCEYDPK